MGMPSCGPSVCDTSSFSSKMSRCCWQKVEICGQIVQMARWFKISDQLAAMLWALKIWSYLLHVCDRCLCCNEQYGCVIPQCAVRCHREEDSQPCMILSENQCVHSHVSGGIHFVMWSLLLPYSFSTTALLSAVSCLFFHSLLCMSYSRRYNL